LRFNLKTKPKPDSTSPDAIRTAQVYEEWFRGFEKELQQKLKEDNYLFTMSPTLRGQGIRAHAEIILIKEILGEG
jgi:hypothetical protein